MLVSIVRYPLLFGLGSGEIFYNPYRTKSLSTINLEGYISSGVCRAQVQE
jgi:hypothetical protein